MPRSLRMILPEEPTHYHIISRTALDGLPFGDIEKEALVTLIRKFSSVYFTEIIGYVIMGNHWHILLTMHPQMVATDLEIRRRYSIRYGDKRPFPEGRIGHFRSKWCNLSEFVKEVKQSFSRDYNKRHDRKGTLWGERFKSVIVEHGAALTHCLSYIDLNPVRAGIVKRPEEYRWSSIGWHAQTGNQDGFLTLDFGFAAFGEVPRSQWLARYREYMYHMGSMEKGGKAKIRSDILEKEASQGFQLTCIRRFKNRMGHFTESGIIGSRAFVEETCHRFQGTFSAKRQRIPKEIEGLGGLFILKRFSAS